MTYIWMFTKFVELTKFIHLLLLKKLITYICGFDSCREQHQEKLQQIVYTKLKFYQTENSSLWNTNLELLN